MLILHHLNPLSWVLLTIGSYKKHPLFRAFSGNLPESTAPKYPLSRENWAYACGHLIIRVRGGGGGVNHSIIKQASKLARSQITNQQDQSIDRPIDWSINQSGCQSIHQSIQSIDQVN